MSHRSVVSLFSDVAKSLADNIQFGYGRRSDFNLIENKRTPYVWCLPLTATPSFTDTPNYQKTWNCALVFFEQDQTDSKESQYKLILDDMDELLDKFVQRLNDWNQTSQDVVGQVTLQAFSQTPFVKTDAGIYTGWILQFQMITPDDFIYCTPDNIDIYAGNS